jgi:hypothetical protein
MSNLSEIGDCSFWVFECLVEAVSLPVDDFVSTSCCLAPVLATSTVLPQ